MAKPNRTTNPESAEFHKQYRTVRDAVVKRVARGIVRALEKARAAHHEQCFVLDPEARTALRVYDWMAAAIKEEFEINEPRPAPEKRRAGGRASRKGQPAVRADDSA